MAASILTFHRNAYFSAMKNQTDKFYTATDQQYTRTMVIAFAAILFTAAIAVGVIWLMVK